jgi:hypothetical protein
MTSADINRQRISQARNRFNSINQQVLSNKKIPIEIRRRLCQAIAVDMIALGWLSESLALKEENRKKLETFHHTTSSLRRMMCEWTMWDITEKRITRNEQVTRSDAGWK